MIRNIFITICTIFCGWMSVWAQTADSNKMKYDFFRERLRTEMMFYTGDATISGSHLPMERRYKTGSRTVGRWADAIWWQGHYLAVLATEYAWKRKTGEDVTATLDELRCALDVYDRLDWSAEACWDADSALNGFYLRDDVRKADSAFYCVQAIASDYNYYCGKADATRHAPSQDQAWGSYIGLALVRHYVRETDVRRHVAEIAKRMVRGMQTTNANGHKLWQITNPITGKVVQKEGDIQWLQYAHGTIGTMLAGENLHFANSDKFLWKNVWNTLQNNVLIDNDGHFTWYGVLSMSAVMDEGGANSDNCYDWLVQVNAKIVKRHPEMEQTLFFPHLPLVNVALYGSKGKNLLPRSTYESYLNSAPADGAITRNVKGREVRSAPPWHSLSLFCPWHLTDTGDGNMLDYMLLYNLVRLVYD